MLPVNVVNVKSISAIRRFTNKSSRKCLDESGKSTTRLKYGLLKLREHYVNFSNNQISKLNI